jgi:hypothetical protein
MRFALGSIARVIDKTQDVSKQQQAVGGCVQEIGTTLDAVSSSEKAWPHQETGEPVTNTVVVHSHLPAFASCFQTFSEAITPQDSAARYRELLEVRRLAAARRSKFADLKKAKRKVGAAALLHEGRQLQALLSRERTLERDLAASLASEWQGAVAALIANLGAADEDAPSK